MFRRAAQSVFIAFFVGLFAGCISTGTTSVSTKDFALGVQDDAPEASDLVAGDKIEVSVEVDGAMEVSLHRAELNYQGIVTLPLVGDVKIKGLKLDEARAAIAKTYGAYYVNLPVVMVAVLDEGAAGEWGNVTVLGRVNKPGLVALTSHRGINLSAAVQAAGGFSSSAKKSGIRISRTDEDGKKLQVMVDFEQIGLAGNAEADLLLMAGDIIYVPERIF
jgi:polysaccharide export outer membrane protein